MSILLSHIVSAGQENSRELEDVRSLPLTKSCCRQKQSVLQEALGHQGMVEGRRSLPNQADAASTTPSGMVQPSPYQQTKEAEATAWHARCIKFQTPCSPEGHTDTGKPTTFCRQCTEKIWRILSEMGVTVGDVDDELTTWTTELRTKAQRPNLKQLWEVELFSLAWTLEHVHHTLKECRTQQTLDSTLLITVSPEACQELSHLPGCLILDHCPLSAEVLDT